MAAEGGAGTPVASDPSQFPVLGDSALSFITETFNQVFGGALLEFAQWAWERFNEGAPMEQIVAKLRETAPYKARFPGMAELVAKGRPINEAAYLDLERTYTQVARQFDLPPGFYDEPSDFGRLISGEVSAAEYQRRLTTWQVYERETRDPVAEQAIREQFAAAGLIPSEGDFLAAVIDPSRAISAIERRLEAGRVATEAARSGFGALSVDEGLSLADQGVTAEAARSGFGALTEARELFSALPGEEGFDTIGREQQIGAAFVGDQASRRRIERNRQRRLGQFSGGGGAALGREGIAGLGAG